MRCVHIKVKYPQTLLYREHRYLRVDGWNSHDLHVEDSSMVVHPLHPRERNLRNGNKRVNPWCICKINILQSNTTCMIDPSTGALSFLPVKFLLGEFNLIWSQAQRTVGSAGIMKRPWSKFVICDIGLSKWLVVNRYHGYCRFNTPAICSCYTVQREVIKNKKPHIWFKIKEHLSAPWRQII